jgi:hypothetical protein
LVIIRFMSAKDFLRAQKTRKTLAKQGKGKPPSASSLPASAQPADFSLGSGLVSLLSRTSSVQSTAITAATAKASKATSGAFGGGHTSKSVVDVVHFDCW